MNTKILKSKNKTMTVLSVCLPKLKPLLKKTFCISI